MAVGKASPGYSVDQRVSIGLDVLSGRQKTAVLRAIGDRKRFLDSISDEGKVQKISKKEPIYTLEMPAGLRIVYSKVGDKIEVLDLIQQATLDLFRNGL